MEIGLVITLAVVAIAAFSAISLYNGLVKARNRADNAWSQIEVQLQRRHDLVPNLVETVKGYTTHEQETLERVIEARNRAQAAPTPEALAEAENQLAGALRQLFALSEAYPDLKASQNFADLQRQLEDTENKVAIARQIYNDAVLTYNNRVQTLPSSLMASATGMETRGYYDAPESSGEAPRVEF